ncbi:CRISPR-associated endonuclease/helicase Cas3 [Algoriphagus ornithinivorans]|uniref:CRISPR-associated endonuclease/helicase Cas3 n=1 Tax=Algoriphagus ornithinivorans TaxID=226506 RepID=A0A1I5E4W3_9BACT|nr:CRISPR-associated helicase/endonuclease Cas3 [Algoriphagus ornithinivorans]SFO06457.1 CRISPR-associated endonuclease/helicase Cas3 [Algoriphagus ornithinivorans]
MESFKTHTEKGKVEILLKDHSKYLAHSPNELLSDHMKLVSHYFLDLVDVHGIEPVIDNLLVKLCGQSKTVAEFAKHLFWETILYHDFGKVNENFQRIKMENKQFPLPKSNQINTEHSLLSAYIFLCFQISKGHQHTQNPDEQQILMNLMFAFAHNIIRHHSSHLDDFSAKQTFKRYSESLCLELEYYLECYNQEFLPQFVKAIPQIRNFFEFKELKFEWFLLIRLNFSLLTAADYYATSHYCNKWKNHYQEFGELSSDLKERHFQNLKTTHLHNKALYENHNDFHNQPLEQLQEKSNNNLNKLRSKMAAEVIANVRQHNSERLFYIEAPTGGGKTNMAFIATQELLHANQELNKVFYVFPFTTLITQTQKAAQETLGLKPDEWIELHGRASWKQKEAKEEDKDGLYGEDRMDDIHNLFVNYPYTFLSHVRFFDILKANDKSSIYLMHRLANSVVVIDEVQAYNPELWDKMAYLLKEYAETLNIRFIVMSATLPKIGDLAEAHFRSLIPDAIESYFTNPNFADRVSFSNELLQRKIPHKEEREDYIEWLAKTIHEKSEHYRKSNGSVRTIVEFIYKKSTTEFASLAERIFEGYQILVLSGTILEPQRKNIINSLKNQQNKDQNVLLITTQVVEAGVDIDMDLGFKNRSIIDSEEQLAGRVNRNVNKSGCTVYLFDLDDASVIYGKDRRFKEWKAGLEIDYFEILRTKRFDRLYDKVKSYLEATNMETQMKGTLLHFRDSLVGQLNFPEIDKEFKLIDQSNTSVFVPLDLDMWVWNEQNKKEQIFTDQQIQFLQSFGVEIINEKLSGEDIFDLYKRLILEQMEDFGAKKQNLKILQSIMGMFTFSLFSESKVLTELRNGGNSEQLGYMYLVSHREVYSLKHGLEIRKMNELNFI